MTAAECDIIDQGLAKKLNFLRHSLPGALDGLTLITELLEAEQICQVFLMLMLLLLIIIIISC